MAGHNPPDSCGHQPHETPGQLKPENALSRTWQTRDTKTPTPAAEPIRQTSLTVTSGQQGPSHDFTQALQG